MNKIFTIIQVVAPIFLAVALGMLARKKAMFTTEQIQSLQSFIVKICLPCLLFRSCLTADLGPQTLTSMVIVIPFLVISTVWAFRLGRKKFPYHNLPMMFCCRETGMLGIPLFMILFGADQAYRMGVLDLAQSMTAIPTIAILTAATGENVSPAYVIKRVFSSPLMILSILGLTLNISGVGAWMDSVGLRDVLTECTGFLGQPISALMIFAVGYNFSLEKESGAAIFRLSLTHFVYFALWGLVIQGLLFLVPGVDALTRWAILLYTTLPASYLAPSLGRKQEDYTMASGVCSVLTIPALIVFCIIAVIVS